jgi:hypothetical protein
MQGGSLQWINARHVLKNASRVLVMAVVVAQVSACESMALTAFGVGASAGVQHSLGGVTYRTFTVPSARVRSAALTALARMSIKVDSTQQIEGGELIKGSTPDRQIEVEVERISSNTTRLRAVAKKNALIWDSATATEIIFQTEKLLGNA